MIAPDRAEHDVRYDIVIPTIGRESLASLLESLDAAGARPELLVIADDRPRPADPLAVPAGCVVVRSGGRGPAAARNAGAACCRAPWVVFLDDDVVVSPTWHEDLLADLRGVSPVVAAVHGRVRVPRPGTRRPTDGERNVVRLEAARWITADAAVRRWAGAVVGGFDERFPRAYREDSDLALRLRRAGFEHRQGDRVVEHPLRGERFWASVHAQRGNADDQLMRVLHGPRYRRMLGEDHSSLPRHLLVTALGVLASLAALRRRRLLAGVATAAWAAFTLAFAWARIKPGPRTPAEVGRMAVTSAVIPPAAVAFAGWGRLRAWRQPPWTAIAGRSDLGPDVSAGDDERALGVPRAHVRSGPARSRYG